MAIYVYISERCKQDCKRQTMHDQVQAFADRIVKNQTIDYFERFHPPLLKKPMNNLRLLASECSVGEHTVVVFERLVTRGGQEYIQFRDSLYREIPGAAGQDEISQEALQHYIDSISEPPPPPAPAPDELENNYLHTVLNSAVDVYRDEHLCETGLWVEKMQQEEFANRLSEFSGLVFETVNFDSGSELVGKLHLPSDKRYGILFRCVPEWKMVVLLTPFKGEAPIEQIKQRYPELLEQSIADKQAVIRCSRRAYPLTLLLSPDNWMQVQKDKEGNMALSEEEIEVLESARDNAGGYPLFINGRAGSGKSTILQYLFAEYVYFAAKQPQLDEQRLPVFFACNDELLSRCSSGVRALAEGFWRNNDSKEISDDDFEQRLDKLSRGCFKNFHKWLSGLVPQGKFPQTARIDYCRFKNWWESSFGKTPDARGMFGPEISWHVIRTYIKGADSEHLLDKDDYEDTFYSTRQNSISTETYNLVFDNVWKAYDNYQRQHACWDDQDLARYVLANGKIKANHPVVFCDEAQDFTRIELEILHKHGLFSERKLGHYEQPRIPFAFAGDPFQTLNPTGFQWESTKAFFTKKFIKNFPGKAHRDMNYCELSYNYRSSSAVVKFCNTLQLLRKVMFNLNEIKPQQPWSDNEHAPSVVFFDRNDVAALKKLQEQSDIRIIIPCEEGAEAEWSKANGLGEFVDFDDKGVPKNVSSASRVKGLEFNRVVLFGFGDECPKPLKHKIDIIDKILGREDQALLNDSSIEPQYFLNRLYVAASRPKKRLMIIDRKQNIQGFWNKIFSKNDEMSMSVRDTEVWENMCGDIMQGTAKSWEGDRERPQETAELLCRDAKLRKDPFLFRQAAQYYDSSSGSKQAEQCRCEALELEQDYLVAAAKWEQLQDYDRSLSAAFKFGRKGFGFIMELAQKHPQYKNCLHVRFAAYLSENNGLESGVSLLRDFVQALDNPQMSEEVFASIAWRDALANLLKALLKYEDPAVALWKMVFERAQQLDHMGLSIGQLNLGHFAYRAEEFAKACECWDALGAQERSKIEKALLRAKAKCSEYPQAMEVYGELLRKFPEQDLAAQIAELAAGNKHIELEAAQHETVLKACFMVNDIEAAMQHVAHIGNEEGLIPLLDKLVKQAPQAGHRGRIETCVSKWFELVGAQERWDDLLRIVSKKEVPVRSSKDAANHIAELKRWLKQDKTLLPGLLVRYIGSTNLLSGAKNDIKTAFAHYLNSQFTQDFGWHEQVHPLLVGSALVQAGLFKVILPYYEAVCNSARFDEQIKRIARIEWMKTKHEQAKWEGENNPNRINKINKDFNALLVKYKVSPEELEQNFLPEILAMDSSLQQPLTTQAAASKELPQSSLPGKNSNEPVESDDQLEAEVVVQQSLQSQQTQQPEVALQQQIKQQAFEPDFAINNRCIGGKQAKQPNDTLQQIIGINDDSDQSFPDGERFSKILPMRHRKRYLKYLKRVQQKQTNTAIDAVELDHSAQDEHSGELELCAAIDEQAGYNAEDHQDLSDGQLETAEDEFAAQSSQHPELEDKHAAQPFEQPATPHQPTQPTLQARGAEPCGQQRPSAAVEAREPARQGAAVPHRPQPRSRKILAAGNHDYSFESAFCDINFKVLANGSRVNFEHHHTGETGFADLTRDRVSHEGERLQADPDGWYAIDDWQLYLHIDPHNGYMCIQNHQGHQLNLRIKA